MGNKNERDIILSNNGHVYCNPEDWSNRLVIIKNGVRVTDETF